MIIDLHGMTENEAVMAISGALVSLEMDEYLDEIEIITGNGYVLKRVLLDILDEEGLAYSQSSYNSGSFTVYKR